MNLLKIALYINDYHYYLQKASGEVQNKFTVGDVPTADIVVTNGKIYSPIRSLSLTGDNDLMGDFNSLDFGHVDYIY